MSLKTVSLSQQVRTPMTHVPKSIPSHFFAVSIVSTKDSRWHSQFSMATTQQGPNDLLSAEPHPPRSAAVEPFESEVEKRPDLGYRAFQDEEDFERHGTWFFFGVRRIASKESRYAV